MTHEEIYTALKRIISDRLEVEEKEITPEKTMNDLGADSLDAVDTLMEIEKEFDIAISDSDMEKLSTIKDILDYLQIHIPNN